MTKTEIARFLAYPSRESHQIIIERVNKDEAALLCRCSKQFTDPNLEKAWAAFDRHARAAHAALARKRKT